MEARDQEPVGAQSPQKRNYSNRGRGSAGLGRGRGQTNASSGSAALTRKDWVKIEFTQWAFFSDFRLNENEMNAFLGKVW